MCERQMPRRFMLHSVQFEKYMVSFPIFTPLLVNEQSLIK